MAEKVEQRARGRHPPEGRERVREGEEGGNRRKREGAMFSSPTVRHISVKLLKCPKNTTE